jgi:hypothetical protein
MFKQSYNISYYSQTRALAVSIIAAVNGQQSTVNDYNLLRNYRSEGFKFHCPVTHNQSVL